MLKFQIKRQPCAATVILMTDVIWEGEDAIGPRAEILQWAIRWLRTVAPNETFSIGASGYFDELDLSGWRRLDRQIS
jgi:hypothetical protein